MFVWVVPDYSDRVVLVVGEVRHFRIAHNLKLSVSPGDSEYFDGHGSGAGRDHLGRQPSGAEPPSATTASARRKRWDFDRNPGDSGEPQYQKPETDRNQRMQRHDNRRSDEMRYGAASLMEKIQKHSERDAGEPGNDRARREHEQGTPFTYKKTFAFIASLLQTLRDACIVSYGKQTLQTSENDKRCHGCAG